MSGTIEVRRPRVRGLEERFESRILPLFLRRTHEVTRMLPELYLHGLSQGDFELALRGLLGNGAPLSASSIGRLRAQWEEELETWRERRLDDRELVYAWADGIYVKAGLEKDKAALRVVIGALSDGRKEVLAVWPGHRESTESWLKVLRDLRDRGLRALLLLMADGGLPIWSATEQVWPETSHQRCWNHKILNVHDDLPKKVQGKARALLTQTPAEEMVAETLFANSMRPNYCPSSTPDKNIRMEPHQERRDTHQEKGQAGRLISFTHPRPESAVSAGVISPSFRYAFGLRRCKHCSNLHLKNPDSVFDLLDRAQ